MAEALAYSTKLAWIMMQERFLLAVMLILGVALGAWYLTEAPGRFSALGTVRLPNFHFPTLAAAVDPEAQALDQFKSTADADFVNHCVGATGDVAWRIFTEEHPANANVRLVQADLKKADGKSLTIQWHYNLETKVADVTYIGDSATHASTTKLEEAANLTFYCGTLFPGMDTGNDDSSGSDENDDNDSQ